MKDRIIYNNILNKLIILNTNNELINNFISDNYLIKDINVNNLPSNIFNNIELYLGSEYECYVIDINELLFNVDNYIDDNGYYFNKDKKYLYNYDEKSERLYFSYTNIYSVLETKYKLKNKVIRCLVSGMVEQTYNWKVDTTENMMVQFDKIVEQALKYF